MSSRSRIRGLVYLGLTFILSTAFPLPASADAGDEAAAAAQQAQPVRPIRRLGGATRFTPPVNTVAALQKTMSTPRLQSDIRAVLEKDNLGSLTEQVTKILSSGAVNETSVTNGTTFEWMALRRAGRPDISRNLRWAGDKPLEGFQFVVDDLKETYTFFVPKICGNIALMSREPSREAARRAEEARKADAAKAEAARQAAEAARKAEDARKAAEAQKEAEARKAAEARQAEEKRKLDAERAAAEARRAEEARKKAEQDRLAAEDEALTFRPFFAGYFGKQQRQYDEDDPAGLGSTRPDNVVSAFGNALVGLKGGVQIRVAGDMESGFMFVPAIGVAINLEEGSRSSLFGDAEVGYAFTRLNGIYLGTGLTLWDITHGDQFTLGWLGTAAIPVWKNNATMRKLDLSFEWRQFFDRMSDPDVNYQFWGGFRYMLK
jgi:nucleoid-associated protein YgaU